MYLGEPCKAGAPSFLNGTTNGAAWYPLTGGMQDYHYIWHGCMEVTLELSCCKYPPASELQQFWRDNRASLLQFIGEAHRGVRGFVKDEGGTPIEGASMKVRRSHFFLLREFVPALLLLLMMALLHLFLAAAAASFNAAAAAATVFVDATVASSITRSVAGAICP